MTRILIADDHAVVRSGMRDLLETQQSWRVVAEAANGQEALDMAVTTKPNVAILEFSLPVINGIEATRQIRLREPAVAVMLYTVSESEAVIRDAFAAGARGYLFKSDAGHQLVAAVEALARGRDYISESMAPGLRDRLLVSSRETGADRLLTRRERNIVALVAAGHTNKEIANTFKISVKTVETHRANAMHKLGLTSTAGLVRYAVRNHMIEP
jgi:DNA-binding NarL/FixJ family response regulator